MNRKRLYLIAAILTSVVFIGYLGETEPQDLFGYPVNIWVIRVLWLIMPIVNFAQYFRFRKAEQAAEGDE